MKLSQLSLEWILSKIVVDATRFCYHYRDKQQHRVRMWVHVWHIKLSQSPRAWLNLRHQNVSQDKMTETKARMSENLPPGFNYISTLISQIIFKKFSVGASDCLQKFQAALSTTITQFVFNWINSSARNEFLMNATATTQKGTLRLPLTR